MPYTPTAWEDFPSTDTAITAARLNNIEAGIAEASGWFNVRTYGAVGDGVADDTAEIQAAIDACQAAEGGIVFLASGNYKISSPLLITQAHVTFMGPGMGVGFDPGGPGLKGAAVLLPTNAAAFTGSAVIRVGQSGTPTVALTGIKLCGFTIAGYSLAANAVGIYAEVQQSQISEIRIENVTSHGMHFRSVDPAGDGWANEIFHNFIYEPGGAGIYMQDAPDNRITENTIYEAGSHGIWAPTAGTMIQNNLISCSGNGVLAQAYDTKVIGNRLQLSNGGIYLTDSSGFGGFVIADNKIWNASRTTNNTTDSINVTTSNTTRGAGVIAGNSFWTNEAGGNGGSAGAWNRARYHINIAHSSSQEVRIGANSYGFNDSVRSYGTAAINNDGTRTQIDPFVLAQTGVAASHTGNTSLTNLASITIPGGLMGKNGRVRISTGWTMTNNANVKSVFVAFGSMNLYDQGVASVRSLQMISSVTNRGAQNSQVASPGNMVGPGTSATNPLTAAIDTAADVTLLLAIILANAGDTITLESYTVEVLPG